MSREPIDVQEAVGSLARAHVELELAFYQLGSFLAGELTSRDAWNAQRLADALDGLAEAAGVKAAESGGGPPSPNAHLKVIANALRSGGLPSLSVIEGGKQDETDDGPDAA
jgi:hypothetical protein